MSRGNAPHHNAIRKLPDFFTANMVMFGVNLTWILVLISATLGFGYAIVAAVMLNCGITLLEDYLAQNSEQPRSRRQE